MGNGFGETLSAGERRSRTIAPTLDTVSQTVAESARFSSLER
jgi:hypothetical protein